MNGNQKIDPMMGIFISETLQQIEQLEQAVLKIEKSTEVTDAINEIFRLMHSIKGSSAMMLFNNISTLAHSIEDLFDFIRKNPNENIDYSEIADIVFDGIDFIKQEIIKIQNDTQSDGDSSEKTVYIKNYLETLKNNNPNAVIQADSMQPPEKPRFYISSDKNIPVKKKENTYEIEVFFDEDCGMENVRAFVLLHELQDIAKELTHHPEDIEESEFSADIIRSEGFKVWFESTEDEENVKKILQSTAYLREYKLNVIDEIPKKSDDNMPKKVILLDEEEVLNEVIKTQTVSDDTKSIPIIQEERESDKKIQNKELNLVEKQESISVNILKLDRLMDLVGELVISEAMVTRNPELDGLPLDSFHKAARQLRKITNDIQDIVTSIRMVPLAITFQKMNRIVRDMSRQLKKEIELEILGENTEVDKNIIEHLSDPLMHIIRNSMDHGIELPEDRIKKGKPQKGKITLEAKNAGGDVWIVIRDDGKGLDKNKILAKAKERNLINKPENELTDKEIFSFIFLPGFSTKEKVTEFSGRGVGMDVVMKNIEKIRGSITIDSTVDVGTTINIKIPLTLAIINGMTVRVGESTYTVPTISIKESFRVNDNELIIDPDGNEMLLVRGQCYPVVRLNQLYRVATNVKSIEDGIIMMVENENKSVCLFADALLGEQQVVVKALPKYINKVKGIAGCTLLGDGSISLILDAGELIN